MAQSQLFAGLSRKTWDTRRLDWRLYGNNLNRKSSFLLSFGISTGDYTMTPWRGIVDSPPPLSDSLKHSSSVITSLWVWIDLWVRSAHVWVWLCNHIFKSTRNIGTWDPAMKSVLYYGTFFAFSHHRLAGIRAVVEVYCLVMKVLTPILASAHQTQRLWLQKPWDFLPAFDIAEDKVCYLRSAFVSDDRKLPRSWLRWIQGRGYYSTSDICPEYVLEIPYSRSRTRQLGECTWSRDNYDV